MSSPSPSPSPSPLQPPPPQPYAIYRGSSLGVSLVEALKQLRAEQELDDAQLGSALLLFDAAISAALADSVSNSIRIDGKLDVYRHCDNFWTLIMRDVRIIGETGLLLSDAVRAVAPESRRKRKQRK